MTSAPPSASSTEPNELRDLVDRLELRDIRSIRVAGGVVSPSAPAVPAAGAEFEVKAEAQYHDDSPDGLLRIVFYIHIRLVDDGKQEVANMDTDLLAEFAVSEGIAPTEDLVREFAEHNAFFMVYPYFRETVHSLSMRLGINPVVFGMLRRNQPGPSSISSPIRATTDPSPSGG